MTSAPPPKRKRGAPKGNLNALRHGIYSDQLRRADLAALQGIDPTSLKDEIAVLRVVARRLVELIKNSESAAELANLIHNLTAVTNSLGRLIRVYSIVAQRKSDTDIIFGDVIAKITRELRLDSDEPPDPPFDPSALDLSELKELIRGQAEQFAQTADESPIASADQ
jgi:hypothetical protein